MTTSLSPLHQYVSALQQYANNYDPSAITKYIDTTSPLIIARTGANALIGMSTLDGCSGTEGVQRMRKLAADELARDVGGLYGERDIALRGACQLIVDGVATTYTMFDDLVNRYTGNDIFSGAMILTNQMGFGYDKTRQINFVYDALLIASGHRLHNHAEQQLTWIA